MAQEDKQIRLVSLSEVKSILKKVEKDREDMLYEQKIALDHANKFAKISIKKTNDLIKELSNLEFIQESHAYKIADLLPKTDDDIKTIFAKERMTLNDNQIKNILEIVKKHYIE